MAEHERRYKIRLVHRKSEVDRSRRCGIAVSVRFSLVQPSSELIRDLAMSLLTLHPRSYTPDSDFLTRTIWSPFVLVLVIHLEPPLLFGPLYDCHVPGGDAGIAPAATSSSSARRATLDVSRHFYMQSCDGEGHKFDGASLVS